MARKINTVSGICLMALLSACASMPEESGNEQRVKKSAENRLGYVRSKSTDADFRKFEYQFSMDVDSTVSFTREDRSEFEKCKIYAGDPVPVETMLDTCTGVLEKQGLSRKMRVATLYNRGLINQNLDRIGPARADFEEAIALDQNFGDADLAMAGLELTGKNLKSAQHYINSALTKKLRHPAYAYYLKGHALELQGEFVRARTAYRRALELRPNWRDVERRIDRIGISWPE